MEDLEVNALQSDAANITPPLGEKHAPDENNFYLLLYQVTVPVAFASIVLFGLLGNSLVIYVILTNEKLQNVTNILLLNLAVADVSFLLICGTFSAIHYALTVWPFGDTWCRVTQYLLYTTCYVTVYTLVAVSVVRYLAVVRSHTSTFIRSKRNAIILILAMWVVFAVAKIPILLVHGVSQNANTNRTECIISGRTEAQQLFASFFVFAYALPLTSICTVYCLIVCHIRKSPSPLPLSPAKRNRQVTRTVVVIVVLFAAGWLPVQIHLLIAYYGTIPDTPAYSVLIILWHCLMYMPSTLNPIVYHSFCHDFKHAFRQIICRRKVEDNLPTPV